MIRRICAQDLEAVRILSDAAGWNQTSTDWARLLDLEPEGCFLVEEEGRIVATATAVCYGQDLAWIGMVLTHPEARRKGHARRVMEAALGWLDGRGVKASRLDATDMGLPLYEALGYKVECEVERWAGAGSAGEPVESTGNPNLLLDQQANGTDRGRVLEALAQAGVCLRGLGGYAMQREGRLARYIGPCIAESREEAAYLIERVVRSAAGRVFWDILPVNEAALELARRLGFEPVRRLKRMARGEAPPEKRSLIYALSGFETG